MADEAVVESLRSIEEVLMPDVRHSGSGKAIDGLHAELSELILHDVVPTEVRQQFETAKNLSLYSWFVYRFHPIARVAGYSCLEAALRIRVVADPAFVLQSGQAYAGFKHMLKHAVKSGWIRNDGFAVARHASYVKAREKALFADIQLNRHGESFPVREPTPEEVERELRSLPYAEDLIESIPLIRNHLAHGHAFLDAGSVSALRVAAEAINQLFTNVPERRQE